MKPPKTQRKKTEQNSIKTEIVLKRGLRNEAPLIFILK